MDVLTKPKNGFRLQVLLGDDQALRSEFLIACKRINKSGSSVIIKLMKEFIAKQKGKSGE